MDSLADAIRYEGLDGEIAVLIANKKCDALERAKGFGIPAVLLESAGKEREAYDKVLHKELQKHTIDLILLVGYMRFLSKWFVDKWHHKIMNIHPSLLPEFAGGRAQEIPFRSTTVPDDGSKPGAPVPKSGLGGMPSR